MVYGIIILIIASAYSFNLISKFEHQNKSFDGKLMRNVFYMHLAMTIAYYIYALNNPSDSHYYYQKVIMNFRGPSWMDFYGTSTTFIEWIGYPFIRLLGFSYEAMMALFSFLGFLGFIFFYRLIIERIKFKHKLFGIDLVMIILLLPNLHFWSGSFGKGSIIFLGISLVFFGLSRPKQRWLSLLIGGLIVYHVRPHVMLVIIASSIVGVTLSSRGLSVASRGAMIFAALISFFFIYQDVLSLIGIEQGEELSQGLDLTHRATELAKATSGVDITNYSLPMQVFTFLYRPLFVDAPGILGLFVSFENVFYVLITLKILNLKGIKFLWKSNFMVKTALFSFISISIALAQISGNLGIAIRQKSQVMILFLFVILYFLDQEKIKEWYRKKQRMEKIQRLKQQVPTA